MVIRWLKFNAVGMVGAVLQLTALWLLVRAGVHYLAATAIAVEAAVLHNYVWHARWTWSDRPGAAGFTRLWRFHLANGFVSLISNLVLMKVFTGWLGIPVVAANLSAIALTSILNFFLGDRWVFGGRRQFEPTPSATPEP